MIKFYTPPGKEYKYYVVGNVGVFRLLKDDVSVASNEGSKKYAEWLQTYAKDLPIKCTYVSDPEIALEYVWIDVKDDDEDYPTHTSETGRKVIKKKLNELNNIKNSNMFDKKVKVIIDG